MFKIKPMNRIKQYFKNRKERERLEEEAHLKSEFAVVERGGSLWLTHDGVAFAEFESDDDAHYIASAIDKCRNAAIRYKRL